MSSWLEQLRLKWRGRSNEPELRWVSRLCDSSKAFVDVGANRGLYCAAAIGHALEIIALEPHPEMASELRRVFGSKVDVREIAASDSEGVAKLRVPRWDGGELASRGSLEQDADPNLEHHEVEVVSRRLDQLALPSVGMLKIDVEGHELAVVRGAEDVLTRDRPLLLVEVEERHREGATMAMFEHMRQRAYLGAFLLEGAPVPVATFDVRTHQNAAHAKQPGKPKQAGAIYINNFLFVHESDVERRGMLLL